MNDRMSAHTRERIRKAAAKLEVFRRGASIPTAGEVDKWHKAITANVFAAWQDYHAACVQVPASDLAEIMSTGEALADVMKAAARASYQSTDHDQTRSEGGTEPTVPAPHEPSATGAGTPEHLS